MNRSDVFDAVYIRSVYASSFSGVLTVDSSAYSVNDFVQSGVIVFDDVFTDENISCIQILGLKVSETVASGSLAKKSMELILFDSCDLSPVANSPFSLSTNTGLSNIVAVLSVASPDYKTFQHSGDTNAKSFSSAPLNCFVSRIGSSRHLYGVLRSLDTSAFSSGASLSLELNFLIH